MGRKGALGYGLVRSAGTVQANPDFRVLRTHILPLRTLWYAPPVTVHRICEQVRFNICGKLALRSKFAKQYEFAEAPTNVKTPPL